MQSASYSSRLEQAGAWALFGTAAAVQFSIAGAQAFFAIAVLCWLGVLIVGREAPAAPRFFWLLIAYAAATLVSAAFSAQPAIGFVDSKQLVLFLIVPVTYRFVSARRVPTLLTVIMTLGAASAAYGIFQYGLLHYDQLSQRPQGTLGHYMTYSGLLMLVVGVALAKLLFSR